MSLDALIDALADAPVIPEGYVDRVGDAHDRNAPAFTSIRWDVPDGANTRRRKERGKLSPRQQEALQRLADGERVTQIAPVDRRNLNATLRAAAHRLGADTTHQAIAIAARLGLIAVSQRYVLGPAFCIAGVACRGDRDPLPPSLRPVIVGVCNGLTNAEIADAKGVSEDTVKGQIQILLRRYGARNRSHLAALAVRHGHVY